MKPMHMVVIGISVALPLSVLPAQAQQANWGSVIGSSKVQPGDSPLVRAAKEAAARRAALKIHAGTVIDNSTLRMTSGGHLAQANNATTALPPAPPLPVASTQPAIGTPQTNKADIQRRISALKKQEAIVGAEADNPYSDQIDEDLVTKRMNEIQGQINQLQTQIGATPQPGNQPAQAPPAGGQLPKAQTSNPTTTPASPPPQ